MSVTRRDRRPALLRRLAPACLLLASLGLEGCVTRPPLAPPPAARSWPDQRAALQALQHFELHGRVAVLAGSEGFNGGVRWEQDQQRARIELDGPLGTGALSLESDGTRLSLATSRGERLDGEAARAELERRIGFVLPLSSLRYWLLGTPDPEGPANELEGADHRLASLEQGGWHIAYPQYEAAGGAWLPKRITIERGAARVRLIVDRWDLQR